MSGKFSDVDTTGLIVNPRRQTTNEVQYTGYARGPNGERLMVSDPQFSEAAVAARVQEDEVTRLRREHGELLAALERVGSSCACRYAATGTGACQRCARNAALLDRIKNGR